MYALFVNVVFVWPSIQEYDLFNSEKVKVTSHRNQTIDLLTTLASNELNRPYHLGFCKV